MKQDAVERPVLYQPANMSVLQSVERWKVAVLARRFAEHGNVFSGCSQVAIKQLRQQFAVYLLATETLLDKTWADDAPASSSLIIH